MQQRATVMSEVFCKTLKKKLHRAIQNKRCGMLTTSVVLLHDDGCPHMSTAACTSSTAGVF
jgi:hypothetical protein